MEAKNEIKIRSRTTNINNDQNDVKPDAKEKISIFGWSRLVGINLVTMASDLSASAGFSLIPPMMLKQGFSETVMTITVGIGPFISMFLVHIIGYWSDHCYCKLGRRRPFIFGLSLFTMLSLVMIPYCKELGQLLTSNITGTAVILGLGAVTLDFSSQAILNPCKSLVSDLATGSSQDVAFSVYSAMYSIGGCIGYLIPALHWESSIVGQLAGSQEKSVFDILFVIFLMFVVINLLVANEKPHRKARKRYSVTINSVSENLPDLQERVAETTQIHDASNCNQSSIVRESCNNLNVCEQSSPVTNERTFVVVDGDSNAKVNCDSSRKPSVRTVPDDSDTCCCCCCTPSYLPLSNIPNRFVACAVKNSKAIGLHIKKILLMPLVLRKLFVVNVICWMSIMTHSMFYSDFVGQAVYLGDPLGDEGGRELSLYDEGVRMGSWGLMIHCTAAAVYAAFIQDRLIDKFGQRWIIIFGMLSFTVSMIGTVFSPNVIILNIWAAISGFGYAAVTSVPYNILTAYHRNKEIYFPESSKDSKRGMGEDMAVLDSAYNFSQIIPSLFVGYLVQITGSANTYMIVSAVFGFISCFSLFFITYPRNDEEEKIVQIIALEAPTSPDKPIELIITPTVTCTENDKTC